METRYLRHGSGTDKIPGFIVNRTYLDRTDPQTIKKVEDVLYKLDTVAVSAVDRFGNESALTRMAVTDLTFADAPSLEEVLASMLPGNRYLFSSHLLSNRV